MPDNLLLPPADGFSRNKMGPESSGGPGWTVTACPQRGHLRRWPRSWAGALMRALQAGQPKRMAMAMATTPKNGAEARVLFRGKIPCGGWGGKGLS
jgi:hypothetical protein